MGDMDWFELAERGTAIVWVALAIWGVFRRLRRLERLGRIILPEPLEQEDVDYLVSVKRSTHIRLTVKVVFLIGGTIALFHLTDYLLFWRAGVLLSLLLMDFETINVDAVRQRLALRARTVSDEQAQRDRMEAVGIETRDMIERGDIGRGETALVAKGQADEIQAAGDDTLERLKREGIGDQP
jgi:hypothetical protein